MTLGSMNEATKKDQADWNLLSNWNFVQKIREGMVSAVYNTYMYT